MIQVSEDSTLSLAPISKLPSNRQFLYIKEKEQTIIGNTNQNKSKIRKSNANRYEGKFKVGTVQLVMKQKRPIKQDDSDLEVCMDTLKSGQKHKKALNQMTANMYGLYRRKSKHQRIYL